MLISPRVFIGTIVLTWGLATVGSVPLLVLRALGMETTASPTRDSASFRAIVIYHRIQAKELLINDLLDGKRGFFEVAAWFETLNATPAEDPDQHWRRCPGNSDGEKVCRQVISWATTRMEASLPASQMEMRLSQMEEELRRHMRRHHGTVVLSEQESGEWEGLRKNQ